MRVASVLLSSSLVACVAAGEDPASDNVGEDTEASCVSVTNQSLIETDRTNIVTEANFNLHHVLDVIRTTTPTSAAAPVSIPSSPLPMFRELYRAFANCTSSATIDPNHYGLACRPAEASFDTLDPFTTTAGALHYTPVALVNRFDLAPANFSYCGESRIVFWKTSPITDGRASIIIELRTPAVVQNGVKTCVPIAQFWANLSKITDPAQRAAQLKSFYYNGLPGMPFAPISARGAGFGGAGQVRLNSFVNNAQWNLREFKWQKVCTTTPTGTTCSAHFVEQTTKNNPSQLLFSGAHAKAPAFQTWFVSTAVPRLAGATDVNQLSLGNANVYNTFESISQPGPSDPTSVQYGGFASAAFRSQIQSELGKLGSALTVDNILTRAETQTCGGCHQLTNFATLGGGLTWPSSNGFTQVDEQGTLSQAMTTQFLPHRATVLEGFLCAPPPAGSVSETVSGLPAGGAN